jgi:hypothetical protein
MQANMEVSSEQGFDAEVLDDMNLYSCHYSLKRLEDFGSLA